MIEFRRTLSHASTLLARGDFRGIREKILKRFQPSVHPAKLPYDINAVLRPHIKKGTKVAAFFYPDGAFRSLFGAVPAKLEAQKGLTVFNLYGTRMSDTLEAKPNAFFAGGDLIQKVNVVDLFLVPTIMDVLPKRGKRALLNHGSFAAFKGEHDDIPGTPEGGRLDSNLDFWEQYSNAQNQMTHFHSFFPLMDYYLMASPHFKVYAMQFAKAFDLEMIQEGIPGDRQTYSAIEKLGSSDVREIMLEGLRRGNKRLPAEISIIPCGYPQIDSGFRKGLLAQNSEKPYITFAPTPINGKPAWLKYSALKTSGEQVIQALLEGFPEHEIVFKPHISDKNAETESLVSKFSGNPRFKTDWSGSSHGDLYSKTALLVSDFSQTAFTFASSYQRPVLFYSAAEKEIPPALLSMDYCQGREQVGMVAQNPRELIEKGRYLLQNADAYREKIKKFTEHNLFNIGRSEDYICEAILKMLAGERGADWTTFKNVPT